MQNVASFAQPDQSRTRQGVSVVHFQFLGARAFRDAARLLEQADDLASFKTALHVNRRVWKNSLGASMDSPELEWLAIESHWVRKLFQSGRTPNDQEVLGLIQLGHQVADRLERDRAF